ncbi:endonuclease/exonuclease/phosphatase family protein [Mangrovicella endophytica]|uniref:endonuclease/exonuclease/phosphatase family protein n=1 Tax=Mangrovicella endophytica TaxID=2066697 RepID=UPI000C9E0351|nr:endonuclease/exonuclease/phosphatase family protein [Mangrovicella endophytica]
MARQDAAPQTRHPAPLGRAKRFVVTGIRALNLAVACTFFGDVVPLFDTLAHFRAHLTLLCLAAVALLAVWRLNRLALVTAFVAAVSISSIWPFAVPPQASAAGTGEAHYRLLQMNLRFDSPDQAAAVRLIEETAPDVITLQEASVEWDATIEALKDRYPHQFACEESPWRDALILSRRPFMAGDSGACNLSGNFAGRVVDFDGRPVTIGAQHLRWPWPGRQWRQLDELTETLGALAGARLIAGDFNATPWSAAMRSYAARSGTQIIGGIGPTWLTAMLPSALRGWIGLPIDNVLASQEVRVVAVERLPATGSDHLPVLVTFTVPALPPAEPK